MCIAASNLFRYFQTIFSHGKDFLTSVCMTSFTLLLPLVNRRRKGKASRKAKMNKKSLFAELKIPAEGDLSHFMHTHLPTGPQENLKKKKKKSCPQNLNAVRILQKITR